MSLKKYGMSEHHLLGMSQIQYLLHKPLLLYFQIGFPKRRAKSSMSMGASMPWVPKRTLGLNFTF
jgi:hypothetical protein